MWKQCGGWVAAWSLGCVLWTSVSADEDWKVHIESGGLLSFEALPAIPGAAAYKVETKTDLEAEHWELLPGEIRPDGAGGFEADMPLDAPRRFVRVRATPPVAPVPAGMVRIPAGTNAGTDPDFGAYSLTVVEFDMDQTAVTLAQWEDVRGWALVQGYTFENAGEGKAPDHPVHSINWYDAVKWCNARSQRAGREPVYYTDRHFTDVYKTGRVIEPFYNDSANGFRLPMDIERHYAARGGAVGRRFPWGDSDEIQHARANYDSAEGVVYDTSPTRGFHPVYVDDTPPYTNPGTAFAANGYGLYDMAGNVQEWCWNWHPDYFLSRRIVRGGNCMYEAAFARVGVRMHQFPESPSILTGFRTVVTVSP